jgi:hypothetical protein
VTGLLKGLGVYNLLLVSAAMLVGCALLLAGGLYAGAREEPSRGTMRRPRKTHRKKEGAFALVFANKYLLYIAFFSLCSRS